MFALTWRAAAAILAAALYALPGFAGTTHLFAHKVVDALSHDHDHGEEAIAVASDPGTPSDASAEAGAEDDDCTCCHAYQGESAPDVACPPSGFFVDVEVGTSPLKTIAKPMLPSAVQPVQDEARSPYRRARAPLLV